MEEQLQKASFAAGCFWCVEAIFRELGGVISATSGYCGGQVENPSYEQVCTGKTGHAEAVQILYDPRKISYEELLRVFFDTHDPTTPNRQGPDVGPQYKSAIFYHNGKQRAQAERFKEEFDGSGRWDGPIVTEIVPLRTFHKAEDYHQDYYDRNPNAQYCRYVIRPKLDKFRRDFKNRLNNT
ncbi:MAG: peptide-methionine (S)-S-oxide reductase MsrA [Candidatus Geothermarchaeales archaeon]